MQLWAMFAGLALTGAQAGGDPEGPRLFTIPGYIGEADTDSGSWFALSHYNIRFSVPEGPERDNFWRLLNAASESGVALRIRFDGETGRLTEDGRRIVYPLCALGAANGAWYGNVERNCPSTRSTAPEAERRLAIGIAETFEAPERSRETLAGALAARPALPVGGQALALITRGDAGEAMSYALAVGDPAHDRLWADILADYRRLAALEPDLAAARFAIARALIALGGYREALDVYRTIGRIWPEQDFEVAVRIGALHRQQGDYSRALLVLDDYARGRDRSEFGMKFHYHRAWTLSLLGRNAEAEREIGEGLTSQPDYASAFQLRACVRARLGRLEPALADQRRALELTNGLAPEQTALVQDEIDRMGRVIAALEAAIAARRSGSIAAPCEGFLDRWSRPRSRSPLLDRPVPPS